MTKGKYTMSDFYCTNCGRQGIPIARKKGQQREQGHLKKLFCIYCGKDTNHVEVKPFGSYTYANFKEEFDLGRFVIDAKSIMGVMSIDMSTGVTIKYSESETDFDNYILKYAI